jgi:membrane protease YdiL (CAAX protease family)
VSRARVWASSCLHALFLFAFAWLVGRGFGYDVLARPPRAREALLPAAGALALLFAIRALLRAALGEEERRGLAVYRLSPRTPLEWRLWGATVLAASAGEEAAYRGVAMQVLWWSLGDPWVAALACSLAFAAAHWVQGLESSAAIFAIAAVMHGLVALTDTLLVAMAAHAAYDLAAGWRIHRERPEAS